MNIEENFRRPIMIIGLDCDGLLVEIAQLKQELVRKQYGLDLPLSAFHKDLIEDFGLSKVRYKKIQNILYNDMDFSLENMNLVDGVLDHLPCLMKEHTVKCVTARRDFSLEIAKQVIENKGIVGLPFLSAGSNNKVAVLSQGKFDVYVDDKNDEVLGKLIGVVRHLILFSQDYNLHEKILPKEIIRVYSWEDLCRTINAI